jgi:hypothetical protein
MCDAAVQSGVAARRTPRRVTVCVFRSVSTDAHIRSGIVSAKQNIFGVA